MLIRHIRIGVALVNKSFLRGKRTLSRKIVLASVTVAWKACRVERNMELRVF